MNRGQTGIASLVPWALGIVVLIAVLGFGSLFMNGLLTTGTGIATSATFNTTVSNGQGALSTFGSFASLIVMAVILALFVGLLSVVQR